MSTPDASLFPAPDERARDERARDERAFLLIAEDSKTQAHRLRILLQQNGYEVEVCHDGQLALEAARRRRPALILADILMPNLDGYALCRALKSDDKLFDVGVLLLTTLWDAADIIKGLQSGADYYLTKPYDDAFLLKTVASALAQPQNNDVDEAAIEIELENRRYSIAANRLQMLHLLLSTYGNAVEQNRLLVQSQNELHTLNSQLMAQRQQIESQRRELEESNVRLLAQATRDSLTGLRNHRALQERLNEEIQRHQRNREPLSLVLLDVDNFKGYNDAFGHPAGDEVLRSIGDFMEDQARASDLVARYGGEEFVILLPQTDRESSLVVAERVRAAIERGPWQARAVTASLGVATAEEFGENESTANEAARLLARADEALYVSKANGRNRVTHHVAGD